MPDGTILKIIEQAKQAGWLKTRPVSNANLVGLLTVELHPGEAETIALALEMKADRLLIDEKDGRALARQVGLRLTGVLAVLLRAKKKGRMKAIRPELESLRAEARFFVAPDLESAIPAEAGE